MKTKNLYAVERGENLLIGAVRAGDIPQIKVLIKKQKNLEARDMYGMTPLIGAALDGNIEAVSLLLEAGADVNAQDNYGR
ncbi:MAG: ankyrin repeat domain-containing protein, partial [Candidatus Anstonellales archaeon]